MRKTEEVHLNANHDEDKVDKDAIKHLSFIQLAIVGSHLVTIIYIDPNKNPLTFHNFDDSLSRTQDIHFYI